MIKKIYNRILLMLNINLLKYRLKYGKNVRFLGGGVTKCKFEGKNSVGKNNQLQDCEFGYGSYTGTGCVFNGVKVGRFCSLGSYVRNITGQHPTTVFVSTHPAFFSKHKAAGFTYSNQQKFEDWKRFNGKFLVEIGNDVWIGDNVILQDDIKIGDGAIIGTGAVVTKDIEPYTVNVGIPAKPIKKRFTDEQIDFLIKYKWWNNSFEWIKTNWEKFDNIEKFIKEFTNE